MRKINCKSDFDFILPYTVLRAADDGSTQPADLGWPGFDWEVRLWTWSSDRCVTVSRRGPHLANCVNDGGRIRAVLDSHGLGPGELKAEYHSRIPADIYPDGFRDVYEPVPLGIELVRGPSEMPAPADVQAILPYIKGDGGISEDGLGALLAKSSITDAEIDALLE